MEERKKKKKRVRGLWQDCPPNHPIIPLPVLFFFQLPTEETPSLPIGGSGLLVIKVRWIIFFFPQFV